MVVGYDALMKSLVATLKDSGYKVFTEVPDNFPLPYIVVNKIRANPGPTKGCCNRTFEPEIWVFSTTTAFYGIMDTVIETLGNFSMTGYNFGIFPLSEQSMMEPDGSKRGIIKMRIITEVD